ncbi:S41 family peptidase [Sutterella wadsworthensis]|uniref:S41 family peptidase n=1 Tax=Sutterella wadsworthensis TaxID=40545 RepID=UPI0026596771|nr:S41 family peptidase [Sutterella wadsworthensis]
MKLRLLSLFVAGALAGALATTGMQVYADKQAETTLPLMEVRQFTSVFNAVKDYYVDEVSDKELLELAVEGMVSGLDPHSSFLDPEGFEDMSEATHGSFGGLGIEVTKDVSGVRVISPIDDTPAARAGIRAGDIITKLDGEATADLTLEEAVKRMRGEPKTKIRLEIARKGEMKPLSFTIERATIKTQSVRMKELADGFGYIRISQFQERTAEDLAANINKLEKSGHLKGLILDLRNDPGGLLQAAIGVSAAFLPEKSDVVSIKGRTPQSDYAFKAVEKDYRSGNSAKALAELTPAAKTVPLVVLINSSSASASEIVAGALQDHKRAVLLGDRSFGKGSVQTILPMTFGEKTVGVKLTTARYYTPSGRSIQARGIEPDFYVDDTPKGNFPTFQVREADLAHHLANQQEAKKSDKDKKAEAEALPYDDNDEAKTPDWVYLFGDDKDWQLKQAIAHLKGEKVETSRLRGQPISVAKKLRAEDAAKAKAQAEAEAKKTKENTSDSKPTEAQKKSE